MKKLFLLFFIPFLLLAGCGQTGPDTTQPTVQITLDGATSADGAYTDSVNVTISAADTGGSGLATTEYSLNGSDFKTYSQPFTLTTPGEYVVKARAVDNADNVGTAEKTFTVVKANAPKDAVEPTVSVGLDGTTNASGAYQDKVTVSINAADEGGSGLAATTYSLDGALPVPYEGPFEVATLGNHTVVARASDGAGNTAEATVTFQVISEGAPTAPPPNAAEVTLNNLDGAPYDDRLVFSRIQNPLNGTEPRPDGSCCRPPNVVHDTATLKITNTGRDPLNITALPIEGPWVVESTKPTVNLPTTVAVGNSLDLTLKFVATGGDLNTGTMTIVSSASSNQYKVVELAGFWQVKSEGGQEPSLQELVKLFGYTTTITKAGQSINNQGEVKTVGDEILSPYWQRVDASKPVTVRQLAAYHQQGPVTRLYWYEKIGFSSKNFSPKQILVHDEEEGQTVLPSKVNTRTPAMTTFEPNGVFGFKVDSEWSSWSLNTLNAGPAVDANCAGKDTSKPSVVCGHHVRFWPVKDRTGAVVPNTYLLGMDYSGINYDFNDNVYLISNIKPAELVPYFIDVAGTDTAPATGSYTNAEGTWYTDTGSGLFRPSTAKVENPGNTEIAGTDDDPLYWTYRGNVGSAAQDQRQLVYNLPVNAGTYTVTLYFAERFWNEPNKRVFDVSIEGALRLDNFDIFSASGGKNTAITQTFSNIQVNDGNLTIVFDPSMDYASIAAIKVTK